MGVGLISRLLYGPQNLEITSSQELAAFLRGGRSTWAGVDVSINEAMKDPAWYAGPHNIAEDIAKLPFVLYESGESRKRATNHRYWRLVHDRVATRWTSQQFREYMTFWAIQDGDSFALKNLRGAGEVAEMIPFRRGECEAEQVSDGEFVYHVTLNGRRDTLSRRHVFHFQGFAMRTEGGAQLFNMSREDIGLSLAAERHGATFFGNGAQIQMGFSIPGELSDSAYERLKASIYEEHTGANAHTPLLMEGGMQVQKFSDTNEQAQYTDTRRFQVTQHSRRVRIPPHKISDLERAHFNNVEQENTNYVVDTLLPWALRWENAYNQQVIGTNDVYAELLFEMLLRGDASTRKEVYASAIQYGWMTPNEVRRRENMPPVEGGDVVYSQLHLATPEERRLAQLRTKSVTANQLRRAGWHPDDILEVVGLPPMRFVGEGHEDDSEPIEPDKNPQQEPVNA